MPTSTQIAPETGGTLTTSNNAITVDVPAGAVTQTVTMRYEPLPAPTITPSPQAGEAPPIPLASFQLTAQQADGTSQSQFGQPLVISVRFDPASLTPDQIARLRIYFFRTGTQTWEALPTQVDTDRGIAQTTVDHFTQFGLFAPAAATTYQVYVPLLARGTSGW